MTAIVRVYTCQGFVIAADGRCRSVETDAILSDDEQKIFEITGFGRNLAAVTTGTKEIKTSDSGEVLVNFPTAVKESMDALARTPSRHDLNWFASKIWPPIHESFLRASRAGVRAFVDDPGAPGVISQLLIYGYYRGSPSELAIQFVHEDQKIRRPRIAAFNRFDPVIIQGSPVIAHSLFDAQEEAFRRFRPSALNPPDHPQWWRQPLTLEDGIEIARNYIMACNSDEGRAIDPERCCGIGGHMHIAMVTPVGFAWHTPPLQR